MPLVTIITPVYNGSAFLDDLILSVRDQDYPYIEHIVIDDGSNDNGATIAILKKYPHLRWWSTENHGQYFTMNEGVLAAKGDIICFISADDIMSKNAVNKAIKWLMGNPSYEAVYGLTAYKSEFDASLKIKHLVRYAPLKYYPYYPYFAQVQHCSLYIFKNIMLTKNLMMNPKIRFVGDYDWIIRILKTETRIGFLNEVLSIIRMHNNQTSSLNRIAMAKEKIQVAQSHGFKGMNTLFYLKLLRIKFNGMK